MNFYDHWGEIIAFILLIIGFVFSITAPSAALSYAIIVVVGMQAGRLIFSRKGSGLAPFILIIAGFLVGFLIGARYGNWVVHLLLFILGAVGSFAAHEKGLIKGKMLWS